jgi:hypothetical protein
VSIGAAFQTDGGPTYADVGQVPPGSVIDVLVTVHNYYEESITVTGLSLTGQAFSLMQDDCIDVMLSANTCTVMITASPPGRGEHFGILSVEYEHATYGISTDGQEFRVIGTG